MNKGKSKASAAYINVDLEIRSRSDLRPLADALSRKLFVLFAGRIGSAYMASFEVSGVDLPPDLAIRRMARALSTLPKSSQRLWKQAHDRVFDIGVEQTAGFQIFTLPLRMETVDIVSKLGARLILTFYPLSRRHQSKLPNTRFCRCAPGGNS